MAGTKNGASTRSGFTLLELLVVMLIIVAAMVFLYPVFSSLREQGREAVCLTHVAQHARAVLMYAQDYDERLPIGRNYSPAGTSDDEGLYPHWWNIIQPYVRNDEVFHCPDDAGYLGMRPGHPMDHRSFFAEWGSSYSSLLAWLPVTDSAFVPWMPRQPGGLAGLPLSAIVNPTRAALTFDSWPYWHSETRDLRWAYTDAVVLNVSFLDGSARRRSYRSVVTYLAYGPAAVDGFRTLASATALPAHAAAGGGGITASAAAGVPRPSSIGVKEPPLVQETGRAGETVRTASGSETESREAEKEKEKKKQGQKDGNP